MAGAKKPGPFREYGGDSPWDDARVALDRPSLRPDFGARGGFEPETGSLWGIRLPWNRPGRPFFSDAGELLDSLVARLENAADVDQLVELIKRILGPQCFALGVVYGAGEAFIVSLADLFGLIKTFVLADLYDATRRNPSSAMWQPGGIVRYMTAQALNEYFGEELHEAVRERDALIAELKAIFQSPGEFFDKLGEEYAKKFKRFIVLSTDSSLESQFQAGRILGEVLLDVVSLIAGGAAVAKGISKIPRLAKLGRLLKGKIKVRTKAAIGGEATVSGGPPPPAPRSASSPPREPSPILDDPPIVESSVPEMPKGFKSPQAFDEFKSALGSGLENAGYNDAGATFQGSSVTGKSFRTGEAFDVGRTSDFDIAISGESLMNKAKELGIPLRSGGVRTGPLTDAQLKKLGLDGLRNQLSSQAGRPVNFMIYSTAEEAIKRAPSIPVR